MLSKKEFIEKYYKFEPVISTLKLKNGKLKRIAWNKGLKCPEQSDRMKGKKRPEISGKNHWNWQNGISFEPYSLDWTDTLKKSIRERDHYVCRVCLKNGWMVHHIDYNKQNCNPTNLITLCSKCHTKTNFNRDKWIKVF